MFIVGDEALYNEKQGDVSANGPTLDHHGGTNCGLVSNLILITWHTQNETIHRKL